MHRWSKLFVPTLREAPAGAEAASHKFLLRAGYIRPLSAGVYCYLFLGQRSLNKIIAIVREEMDSIGQEFLLPALHPRELWEESGRWTGMGQNMFRLQDRKGAWLALGMTHEEVMTDIARKELRSYKQLPQIWYQIQTKFRDEPRPRSGLLRVRQFLMKDSYSFDMDEAGLDRSYKKHDQAYRRIFTRCGLRFAAVDADSGAMGGSQSQEFVVASDAGEDLIATCAICGYAANLEKAASPVEPVEDLVPSDPSTDIATPGITTIGQLEEFLQVEPAHLIKTLAYVASYEDGAGKRESIPVVIFIRGDHSLNEAKLTGGLIPGSSSGAAEFRPMQPGEVRELFGAEPGSLGPTASLFQAAVAGMGKPQFYADKALLGRKYMIAGANKTGFHRRIEEGDLPPDAGTFYDDFRLVKVGDRCPTPQCAGRLEVAKAIEIGHIFKLGNKYTESMGARVLDANGKEIVPIMGCYGIGMERILTAAIEQNHDDEGFWMPSSIAPFEVVVTVTNVRDADLTAIGERAARQLGDAGFDVLLDDRDERAGVKFKDADLVGIPYRVNVGRKAAAGYVELIARPEAASRDVEISQLARSLTNITRESGIAVLANS